MKYLTLIYRELQKLLKNFYKNLNYSLQRKILLKEKFIYSNTQNI